MLQQRVRPPICSGIRKAKYFQRQAMDTSKLQVPACMYSQAQHRKTVRYSAFAVQAPELCTPSTSGRHSETSYACFASFLKGRRRYQRSLRKAVCRAGTQDGKLDFIHSSNTGHSKRSKQFQKSRQRVHREMVASSSSATEVSVANCNMSFILLTKSFTLFTSFKLLYPSSEMLC